MRLDELISEKARIYSERIGIAAGKATKEEEIRIASEKELVFIEEASGVRLEGKHEFTVASGRIDSVYDRVIIEYKNPSSPGARIGPKSDSPGTKKVVEQIKSRFYDMRAQHGQPLNTLFGVGLDGRYFVFIRFRDDKWFVQDPVPVSPHSTERFLWALFNLGTKGKPFSPDELAKDFGSDALLARTGVKSFYETLLVVEHPKALVFFNQWRILFGEVCGYDVDTPSEAIQQLAEFYELPAQGLKPAHLLFSLHTYYALFMKLLASEIVASFHPTPTPLRKIMQATTSNKLKREMQDLEAGSVFRHLNITNFLEGDLFAWYISVWSEPVEKLIRALANALDQYNPGTLLEDPAESRDLLKKLYQRLFPKSVRHDLGEYYTPDWLAEHLLGQLDYAGDPDKRLLDPACGSGTFLVMAINRVLHWYDERRESCPYGEGELCRKILSNVVGFELNPLAVMAARTNYLIAIRHLIRSMDKIEIPVYLCDSIMTPSEHGGLFAGHLGTAKELKTAAATFIIPTEIATKPEDVARYAELLEQCVSNAYAPQEFLNRCIDEGLPISETILHTALYTELVKLDRENKNGVWARIIKNAFAPLFIPKVDFVVGNPPWINWRHLPQEYRQSMVEVWTRYGLFTQQGLTARLGAGMDDISVLMTYVSGDMYLVPGGRLGFVITQTLFQSSGGGQGFRRFRLPNGLYFRVVDVDDFSSFQPFEGATNRTASMALVKSETPTEYPVKYTKFTLPAKHGRNPRSAEIDPSDLIASELEAIPVSADQTSAWSVAPRGVATGMPKIAGKSPYQARIGAHSGGASGVFWVKVIKHGPQTSLIENCFDIGRNKFPSTTASVESLLVMPLIRGRDVSRWKAEPSLHIVMPYDNENDGKAIVESRLKREFPKTFAYFKTFNEAMLNRAHYRQHFEPSGQPYWSMYNVGNYTFARYQVVWREQTSSFRCAVLDSSTQPLAIVDHKLSTVACNSSDEAHYLAALLNSSPAVFFIQSYVINIQISTHVLKYVKIERFSASTSLHQQLAEQSRRSHRAAIDGDAEELAEAAERIDELAGEFWGLTTAELAGMRISTSGQVAPEDEPLEEVE